MASKSLGTLTVSLLALTGGFERGMTAAERASDKTAKTIKRRQQKLAKELDDIYKGVGIAIGAAFAGAIAFSKKLIDANDQLYKMARSAEGLNVSVKFLSGLNEQADDLGVNMQQVAVVFGTLNRQIATAQRGSATAKGMFAEFGIDPDKVKDTESAFLAIADSVQKYGLNAKRAGILTQIFGASGKDIVPILQQGSAAILAQNDAMAKTGQTITDDALPAITSLYDAADGVGDRFTALRNNLVVSLAPALTETLGRVDDFIAGLDKDTINDFAQSVASLASTFVTLTTNIANGFRAVQAFGKYMAFRKTGVIDTDAPLKDQESQFNALLGRQKELQDRFDTTGNEFVKHQLDEVKAQVRRAQDLFKAMEQLRHPGGAESAMTLTGKDVPSWMKVGLGDRGPSGRPDRPALPGTKAKDKTQDFLGQNLQRGTDDLISQMGELDSLYSKYESSINGVTGAEQSFNDRMADANTLLQGGAINWDQYTRIATDSLDQLNGKAKDTFDPMTQFAIEAARNIQDAFANFLIDPLQDGFKGLLESFAKMLQRMAAELAASQLLQALGTAMSGSSTGWVAALGKAFAGGKATGGPVGAGTTYLVGERGPELFTPSSSGRITPNNQMGGLGGGGNITVYSGDVNVTNTDGGQDDGTDASAARQLGKMIEAQTKQIIVRAMQPGGLLWKQRNGVTA